MATLETRQKILDASLHLYNEIGISNVRLQQIADESGISIGNLAYHFNNKEAITESLVENIADSIQALLRQYGKFSLLNDLDFFFKEFHRLGAHFRFFNLDMLEIKRNFPASYELLQPQFNKIKLQVERRFDLFVQQRLINKESNIKILSSNVWLMMFFMPSEGQMTGRVNISEHMYRRRLWDYITHYFTPKGATEFSASIEPELVRN